MSGPGLVTTSVVLVLLVALEFTLTLGLSAAAALSRIALRRLAAENGEHLAFVENLRAPWSPHRIAAHLARQFCLLGVFLAAGHAARSMGWSHPWAIGLAGVAIVVVFLLDSIVARAIAVRSPRQVLRRVGILVRTVHAVLAPAAALAATLIRRAGEGVTRTDDEREDEQEEEVEAYFEVGEREGILEADEGKMMRSIVDLGDTLVREIMTPRPDILAIQIEATVGEARDAMLAASHSKMPVYRDSIENVVGVLHIRDLVRAWNDDNERAPVRPYVRPPLFVPETQTVDVLLHQLRTRTAIALVVDEYGGIAGLVTLEDILEEIVGDIRDEHDAEEETVQQQADGSWLLSGLVHVETLEELFDIELPIENRDFDTVGGLVVSALGRVPATGEEFDYGGLHLRVVEADARRVYRVETRRSDTAPGDDEARSR